MRPGALFSAILAASVGLSVFSARGQVAASASVSQFLNEFANPSGQYRSVPFMVWNHNVSPHRIDDMLRGFAEQGFGGVFIHPRQGLVTPYLSERWHELVKYTVQRGRELGLDVWLYDENSYPSGFGGGYVPSEMPESYDQGQGLRQTVVGVMPECISKYEVVVSEKGGRFENITSRAAALAGKRGKFYLYEKTFYQKSPWYAGGSYVDLLKPGVTQKFIEVTMRGYEKHLGPHLARNIKGIFTDEPEIVTPGGLRWTPDLFEQFRLARGYDLSALLPCLNEEVGDWKRVRHDYFKLLLHLFIDRWAKPWYAYCQERGLVWTGHYWEHCWPNVTGVTDNMALAAWQQMPGIDMLFNTFDDEAGVQFGNIRAVKEVVSVANQLGRNRVLSETYGGTGWQTTFRELKRLADWQFVLGVNFLNHHLSPMSILGIRKSDYPPFFYRQASWWDDYRLLGDYNARLSAAMSLGDQLNDILVLEPTTSVWLYSDYSSNYGIAPQVAKAIGDGFQKFVTRLEKSQVEYDLGCEEILKDHGRVEQGHFVVGRRSYHTFVVPPLTENVEGATFELLKEFVRGGGRIVSLASPTRVDGVLSNEVVEFFNSPRLSRVESLTDDVINGLFRSEDIRFLKNSGGDLYHHRREFTDGQLLLLANVSLDEALEVEVEIRGGHLVRLDALNGKTYTVSFTASGGMVKTAMRLDRAETALLLVTETVQTDAVAPDRWEGVPLQPVTPLRIARGRDNVLVVDFLDLECGGETLKDVFYETATKAIFNKAGLAGNPWWRAIQHKQEIVRHDYSDAPPFTAIYRFSVDEGVDCLPLRIVVENPAIYTVMVNGNEVHAGEDWILDQDFKCIDIGGWVRKGANEVSLSAPHPSAFTELAAIYVLGDFNVFERNGEWLIAPATENNALIDWKQLGAPFYPWEMLYTKNYDVTDLSKRHWVEAGKWRGSLVQVWVNDRKAGVIFTESGHLDVTPFVKQGNNKVELRVVGNLQNMLGPHHKPYKGLVTPWHFVDVEAGRSASEYILTPFGLVGDFTFNREK